MKRSVLLIALSLTATLFAANHKWQEAVVTAITPFHGLHATQYSLRVDNVTYVLSASLIGGCQPFLTLNGKTQISVEGRNAFIQNDDGKVCKMPIAQKVATVSN